MRLKKNRKALIIEEAWKAIASPMMAGYILYLYKTVRKFGVWQWLLLKNWRT